MREHRLSGGGEGGIRGDGGSDGGGGDGGGGVGGGGVGGGDMHQLVDLAAVGGKHGQAMDAAEVPSVSASSHWTEGQ